MSNITFSFKAVGAGLTLLDRIFKSNLHVDGLENISGNPTLYVVNHFTRSETLLLPYVIYKYRKEMVHSLADADLFHGRLGNTMRSLGAISTREPFRNRKIIQELMTGQNNWVIFPEGLMVKNKMIYNKGKPRLDNPERQGLAHTGAAVLALKAELIKRNYLQACKRKDSERMKFYEDRYNFKSKEDLCFKDIVITPVNITYHPVRPCQNFFISLARLFSKDLPKRVEEELKIEGSLLLTKTDISIYFGKAISLYEYLDNLHPITNALFPFVDEVKRSDWIVGYQKSRLTKHFMNEIYTKVAVNIDHLFAACLRYQKKSSISEKSLKVIIYLVAHKLRNREDRRIHPSLSAHNLLRMISDHYHEAYENICSLAIKEGAITKKGDLIEIKATALRRRFGFHSIRLKNLISVFANEVEPLTYLIRHIKDLTSQSHHHLKQKLVKIIEEEDRQIYLDDHHKYRSPTSKPIDTSGPHWYRENKSKVGVVLCHGYLASPAEMTPLAEFLHQKGVNVYTVRLRGHGTSPHQLKDIELDDWIDSFDRAYSVIRNHCQHVIVGGFSAGGLMALLAGANKSNDIQGVFSINAALQLKDIRTKLIPTVTAWNGLLDHFHIDMGKFEVIDNDSESPEVNYHQNYLHGVKVLEQLSARCRSRLDHVIAPTLILQADQDPVVNPQSAQIIHDTIPSDHKRIIHLDDDRHIIVTKDDTAVFEHIAEFIDLIQCSSKASSALMDVDDLKPLF